AAFRATCTRRSVRFSTFRGRSGRRSVERRDRKRCRARRSDSVADAPRCFQTMVPMRDGTRLNTFVYLPEDGGPRFPVILQRTPYGIAAAGARDKFDHTNAWLPS